MWAEARVAAEARRYPLQALAFLVDDESVGQGQGLMALDALINFFATVDKTRGSIGVLNM